MEAGASPAAARRANLDGSRGRMRCRAGENKLKYLDMTVSAGSVYEYVYE